MGSVWDEITTVAEKVFNLTFATVKKVAVSKQVETQFGSALLVSSGGEVFALGQNKNGCLGLESDETREPVKVEELSLVSGVCVCEWFGDALAYTREGKLYVWGANVHENTSKKPVLLENLPNIIDARCTLGHYLALADNGKVYEWRGVNTNGNRLSTLNTSPTLVELEDDIASIACGPHHSLAVTKHGDVYSFGMKCVSIRSFTKQEVTKIPLLGETVAKVDCGCGYSLALTQSGKIYTWGWNGWYLGDDGGSVQSDIPLQVGGNIGRFVDIATNSSVTNAAKTESGAVYMWGYNGTKNAVKTPKLTECTELQQVFSNISNSICVWTFKDSYSVTQEDSASLGMQVASSFNEMDFSDLTLLVENKPIYVHKYVLRLRSKFFCTWLQDRWTDKSKRELELTCYTYDVYMSYLWFLYSGEIKTSSQHILDLLDLADAYGEEKLKLGCESLVMKNMSKSTLLKTL